MDHILYPTLTETGFHTEVHHITGEGTDGGVVYCEMQGRENTSFSLLWRRSEIPPTQFCQIFNLIFLDFYKLSILMIAVIVTRLVVSW